MSPNSPPVFFSLRREAAHDDGFHEFMSSPGTANQVSLHDAKLRRRAAPATEARGSPVRSWMAFDTS